MMSVMMIIVMMSVMIVVMMSKHCFLITNIIYIVKVSYTDSNGRILVESIVPNGSNIQVTRTNIREYIHRLANHKQNVLVRNQCRSLLKGFRELIPIEWIRVFNTTELQLLISGDHRLIDIIDMKKYVNYGSGYHESQSYIEGFWNIVSEMTPQGNV